LTTIAGGDVFFDAVDGGFEISSRPVRLKMDGGVAGARSQLRCHGYFLVQSVLNLLSLGDRAIVEFAQPSAIGGGFVDKNYRHDLHLQAHPIERHDITKEHHDSVVSFARRGPIDIEHRLKPTRRIVTEIANCAACKRSQSPAPRKFLIVKIVPQKFDGVFLMYFASAVLFYDRFSATPAQSHPR